MNEFWLQEWKAVLRTKAAQSDVCITQLTNVLSLT